jgi:hypothetical protein
VTAAPATTAEPSAEATINALRLELIEESADLMLPFVIGARQAARNGDLDRLGELLRAVWLAATTMRQAFKEIAGGGEGGDHG